MDGAHCVLPDNPVNASDSDRTRIQDDNPNMIVYRRMEELIKRMQAHKTGVPVKTVKSFMSKIPSVFTGQDLIIWIMAHMGLTDQTEALHLANLMASHGYFHPIDDHVLQVKNDSTSFYRFQTRYYWPSNCWAPENTDYAVYLCKRTMQHKARLELADYEAENLARLQKMFSRKWEFIFMQAEAQSKVDKKRDKQERKILDTQERAFWDVYRPPPGSINTTEMDIKKVCRIKNVVPYLGGEDGRDVDPAQVAQLVRHKKALQARREKRTVKMSKCAETYVEFFTQYHEYDPFLCPQDNPCPWITDDTDAWENVKCAKDLSAKWVKRWSFSAWELLRDKAGRDHFLEFLEKEYATENLLFVESVWNMKRLSAVDVADECKRIWFRFMAPSAEIPVNVDSKSYKITQENMKNPDRWTFDIACAHLYYLMTSDSYSRYLRSSHYKDFLEAAKKKSGKTFNLPKLSTAKLNLVNSTKEQLKDGFSNIS